MNLEKERELFEAYYIANHHDGDIHPHQNLLEWSDKGEFYFTTSVNDLWDAWLASASREGYKMVPVKLPKESEIKLLENNLFPCLDDIHDMYKAMIGAVE